MSGLRLGVFAAAVALLMAAVTALSLPARMAPDLALHDIKGAPLTLGGGVKLVSFWATTCAVCVAEMPQMVALHEALAHEGLAVIAVSMPYDAPVRVVHFAYSRRLPFHVVMDLDGAIGAGFGGVAATPTLFLVGRRGEILLRIVGRPDFARLQARIRRALAQPA